MPIELAGKKYYLALPIPQKDGSFRGAFYCKRPDREVYYWSFRDDNLFLTTEDLVVWRHYHAILDEGWARHSKACDERMRMSIEDRFASGLTLLEMPQPTACRLFICEHNSQPAEGEPPIIREEAKYCIAHLPEVTEEP